MKARLLTLFALACIAAGVGCVIVAGYAAAALVVTALKVLGAWS